MRMIACATAAALLAAPALAQGHDELVRQVFAAESSFAATMAARNHPAFASFIAPDAIFFGREPLRGKAAVVEAWTRFFAGPDAPFSWRPETVEVLESGTLALTSGPVRDPAGKQTGTFNSVWRREPDGRWLVVFDKGSPLPCETGEGGNE
ncbi:MAG TPA: nuclear transport factor 2 family protein [Gemmatimonadales bacterium]|nr:nuclear transport factor 2 family protein [Gemmatimonadales bacterium]